MMAKASNYHLFIEMCWRNMKETQDWYKSCGRSKLFIILTPVIIKQSHFLINSEFNTGCDGLYSYSLFLFLLGDLNCEYFFLQLGLKIWLEFSISVLFPFELLDLHAKQGSGLISNFIQFFFGTPTYIILGCNCIIQVKGIWSVALEMSYWKIIVSVF